MWAAYITLGNLCCRTALTLTAVIQYITLRRKTSRVDSLPTRRVHRPKHYLQLVLYTLSCAEIFNVETLSKGVWYPPYYTVRRRVRNPYDDFPRVFQQFHVTLTAENKDIAWAVWKNRFYLFGLLHAYATGHRIGVANSSVGLMV